LEYYQINEDNEDKPINTLWLGTERQKKLIEIWLSRMGLKQTCVGLALKFSALEVTSQI
jgi:hypothetical protein